MLTIIPPMRGLDRQGAGHFGAKRGARTHKGVDLACYPGSEVLSITAGEVTKIGYPYNPQDPRKGHLRYVEVTDPDSGMRFRYFYIDPTVRIHQLMAPGSSLGMVQDLTKVYKGITPHVHLEIIDSSGLYHDPGNVIDMDIPSWP